MGFILSQHDLKNLQLGTVDAETKKPTILVIITSRREPSKLRFRQLEHKYNLVFWVLDRNVVHDEQSRRIVRLLRDNRLDPDSVVGFSEEPSLLAAVLATQLGSVYTSPQSICRAQHKAVFAQIARKIDENYPPTIAIINPDQTSIDLEYPVFIRPARGSVSEFAYRIDSEDDLAKTLKAVFGKNRTLKFWQHACETYLEKPPPVSSFLLQPFIEAPQFTVDGFVYKGAVRILGIAESIYDERREHFLRFDLLTNFPQDVQGGLQALLERTIGALGFDNSNFSVEFFLANGREIILIEFNTRASAAFTNIYCERYQSSLIDMMIQISLGNRPNVSFKDESRLASNCVLRVKQDHYIKSIPTPEEVEQLKEKYGLIDIDILVEAGKKLSDYKQDSYSYRYAFVDIAGNSRQEILDKLGKVRTELKFELEPV